MSVQTSWREDKKDYSHLATAASSSRPWQRPPVWLSSDLPPQHTGVSAVTCDIHETRRQLKELEFLCGVKQSWGDAAGVHINHSYPQLKKEIFFYSILCLWDLDRRMTASASVPADPGLQSVTPFLKNHESMKVRKEEGRAKKE